MDDAEILARLRKICLGLDEATEIVAWGHPTFRVRNKIFAALSGPEGEAPSISLKVGKSVQEIFLQDTRFFKTPYVGQHGWVSLRTDGPLDWEEVTELVRGSYELISGKRKKSQ
jgi:predicted DNA-binding protein (MmcQ/YjbR family)